MSTFRPLVAVVISFSALMGAACSKKGASPESEIPQPVSAEPDTTVSAEPAPVAEETTPPPVEEPPPAPPSLTDAQVAKVLAAVDQGEIDQAKIAQKKSKNPKVKKFAKQMIQHHTKSKQKGAKLVKKAKLTPEDSDVAAQLTGKATAQLDSLKTADAASIDALYISGQAEQHQQVLDLINNSLMPSATHEELKALLGEVKTMVEEHTTQAKELQASLTPAAGVDAAPATPGAPATP